MKPEEFESYLRSFRPVEPPPLPVAARPSHHRRWLVLAAGLLLLVFLALARGGRPAEPDGPIARTDVAGPSLPAPVPEPAPASPPRPDYLRYRATIAADPAALERLLDREARRPVPRPARPVARDLY